MTIQKADAREKKIALIVIVGVLLLALGGGYLVYIWQSQITELARLGDSENAMQQFKSLQIFILSVLVLSLLGVAFALGMNGAKALAQARYPAEGVPVFKDTEVLEGDAAKSIAKKLLGVAGVLIFAALALLIYAIRI